MCPSSRNQKHTVSSRTNPFLLLIFLAVGSRLHAQTSQDSVLSLQGFSGILNTPNAHVQQEGTLDVLYTNQRDDFEALFGNSNERVRNWQDNYLFSIGMFNFVEVGGRLTNSSNNSSPNPVGIRDLSVNWKLTSEPLTRNFRFSPTLAVGMQDVGGGLHFFKTKYAAGSVDPASWLRLSVGYGTGPDRMKGVFGGIELQAHDWVTLLGEYDTHSTSVGVRLTAPPLPYVPARLTATLSEPIHTTRGLALSGGFNIPLNFKRDSSHDATSSSRKTLWAAIHTKKSNLSPLASVPTPSATRLTTSPLVSSPIASAQVSESRPDDGELDWASFELVRERLIKAGFVNVTVGLQGATLVVEYENIRYNHSELDAIGVVAGITSQAVGSGVKELRLVVKRKGLALLQIEAQLLPLRDWLDGRLPTGAFQLNVTQKLADESGTAFIGGDHNLGRLKPSVLLYPNVTTFIGTEYGLFDYELSIRPEIQLPLWAGATAVARWDLPVAWSRNLDDGQVYSSYRTSPHGDRLMFFQALPIIPGLVANLGGGKILDNTNGTLNELSWTPGDGANRVKVTQLWGLDGNTTKNVLLGSYRYFLARKDLAFEGTGGRFYGQDTGFSVSMQRFFGDTSVSLYFKDTVTPNDSKRWLQAGLQVEFPLTPRRDMKARPIQIRGHEDWGFAQETGVASSPTQDLNYVKPGLGIIPTPTENLGTFIYDRERLNADYILSHTERIRGAWQAFRNHI